MMPQVGRCKSLNDREYCIIDAGQQHEKYPVVESQEVLLRHEDRLTHPKKNQLGEPRDEVASRCDDILFGVTCQMGVLECSTALVKLAKLYDYDTKTDELDEVCDEARSTDNVVKDCLEILNRCVEFCEKTVIYHVRRVQEEVIFDHMTDGEHQGQDKHRTFGNMDKSLDSDV